MDEPDTHASLRRLETELERLKRREPRQAQRAGDGGAGGGSGLGMGWRVGIELVTAVVVGTGLGWALDRALGTRPWGMIVLFFLGVAAGMLSVYRAIAGVGGAAGFGTRGKDGKPADRAPGFADEDED